MKYQFVALLVLLSTLARAQDGKTLLLKSAEALKKHKSVEYTGTMRFKSLDSDDTSTKQAKVFLQREGKDTILGCRLWCSQNDTIYRFYDLKSFYFVNRKERKVMKFKREESWMMTGNTLYDVVWKDFIDTRRIIERMEAAESIVLLPDTVIENAPAYSLRVKLKDEDDLSDQVYNICLTKKDIIPVLVRRKIKYQDNYQFNELFIRNYSWDKVPPARFSATQIPKDYTTEIYKREEEDYRLLDSNSLAPMIAGRNYQRELQSDTVRYEGKITILDFWYMSCHPCILAIPQMEKLREKYKHDPRVQVIGVNAYDSDEKSIKRIPKFLGHNPIEYPILLVDRDLPDAFKVKAWPTFYIINDGKVAYSRMGFSENLFEEIDAAVQAALK